MPATGNRRSSAEIATTLKGLVAAVGLPGTLPGGGPGHLAFERVELFDSEDLVEAFRFLLITEQRVCVVVPLEEEFEDVTDNRKLIVKRLLPVGLLIGDRVLGSRQAALYGDVNNVGAFGLMELTLPTVTGLILPNPGGVVCKPTHCGVMNVRDTEKNLPSRVTVALTLHCRGGHLEAGFGAGAVF